MTNLTIEMPDELAPSLEGIAAAQHESVQQLAIEQLTSLVSSGAGHVGSPAAVLWAMQQPSHLGAVDVAELDNAIAAGRLAVQTRDLFSK